MKIALLTKYDSYCGREYAKKLEDNGINFDLISFSNKNKSNSIENIRTNFLWQPVKMSNLKHYTKNHYNFKNFKSKFLLTHLHQKQYDIGIQGGVEEKISDSIIDQFRYGILNFHPGDICFYRGSSSPERQILRGLKVRGCCHLITNELDMGDIISYRKLNLDYSSYHLMRSTLYPNLSLLMISVLKKILINKKINIIKKAPKHNLKIYKFIGEKNIKKLIQLMSAKK